MQTGNARADRQKAGLRDLALHKYEAVHARAIAMIHIDVEDCVPYFLLAILSADHKNFVKAEALFQRAIALAPDMSLYRAYYAKTLTHLNRQNEAREQASMGATLAIYDANVADMLGVVLSRTGFHKEAVPMFEKAIDIDPKPANFHYNLASSLQFSGAFQRAEHHYGVALARDPKLYRAWSSLVGLARQTQQNNHLRALEAGFEAAQTAQDADAALHFGHALAKTYEDLGDHPKSLNWLKRAKQAKRETLAYDIRDDIALFRAAQAGQGGVAPRSDPSPQSEPRDAVQTPCHLGPIFIVGLPRTGTTLVDRILSSHSDVTPAGELNTFAGLIKSATGTPSLMVLDSDTLTRAEAIDLRKIGAAYWDDTTALRGGAPRMTDKMPLNFFYARLIYRAMPNARIVALRRGAMDSCLSNYRQLFSTNFSYYNYSLNLRDTAQYYAAFDGLMAHWRATLPANNFMEIHYENIVFDQEVQTRRLLEFCGLDWQDACMNFHENTAPVSTASSVQVRQPLYSASIGRWKKYGDGLADLRKGLGPLAE